uniref:Nuclear pore complex protein NUP96 C-terminal domain-containing protein n=1 Tax=Lotharella globosa TaxID=91324 RepID=A0A7S3Z888_9EUKA
MLYDDYPVEEEGFPGETYEPSHQDHLNALKLHHMNALDGSEDEFDEFGGDPMTVAGFPIEDATTDYPRTIPTANSWDPPFETATPKGNDEKFLFPTSIDPEELKYAEDSAGPAKEKLPVELEMEEEAAPEPIPHYWPPPPQKEGDSAYQGQVREAEDLKDPEAKRSYVERHRSLSEKIHRALKWLKAPRRRVDEDFAESHFSMCPSRSFCVGWGPNGQLIIPRATTRMGKGTIFELEVRKVKVNVSEDQQKWDQKLLNCHREHRAKEGKGYSEGLSLCAAYEDKLKDFVHNQDKEVRPHHPWRVQLSVWKLVRHLWLYQDAPRESFRVGALSAWLHDAVDAEVREEIEGVSSIVPASDAEFNQIRAYLTGYKRQEGADFAQRSRNSRLAVLVAQAGRCQADMREQLIKWEEAKNDKHMSKELLRIYQILSGNVSVEAGGKRMSWLRALGLHLWYADSSWPLEGTDMKLVPHAGQMETEQVVSSRKWTKTVSSVIDSYLRHARDGKTKAAPPWPVYDNPLVNVEDLNKPDTVRRAQDVRLSLIQLSTERENFDGGLGRLLLPEKAVRSRLDHSLSWHLHEVLRRPGMNLNSLLAKGKNDNKMAGLDNFGSVDVLITNYVAELEMLGHWKWAVYILMDTSRDPTLRNYLKCHDIVQEILYRHAAEDDGEEFKENPWEMKFGDMGEGDDSKMESWADTRKFLTQYCKVPKRWINDALALRARSEGNSDLALKRYLEVENWPKAHEVLMDDLVPSKFAEGCEGEIRKIFEENTWEFNKAEIADWKYGGRIVKCYFRLPESKFDEGPDSKRESLLQDCLKFMPDIPKLMDGHQGKDRLVQRRFARAKILSELLKIKEYSEQLPTLPCIDELLGYINEHDRIKHLDRLSVRLSHIEER